MLKKQIVEGYSSGIAGMNWFKLKYFVHTLACIMCFCIFSSFEGAKAASLVMKLLQHSVFVLLGMTCCIFVAKFVDW